MNFIPKGYDKVSQSNYMKFQDGANKVRFLTEPITGYEYWIDKSESVVARNKLAGEGGKPMRAKTYDDFDMEQRSAMKPFAAATVWNYEVEKVQILQVKQVGIMNALSALVESESWGDVTGYDVVITRTKTGPDPMNVEYSVMPEPKKDLDKAALDAYEESNINLEALYAGDDPFSSIKEVDVDIDEILEGVDAEASD